MSSKNTLGEWNYLFWKISSFETNLLVLFTLVLFFLIPRCYFYFVVLSMWYSTEFIKIENLLPNQVNNYNVVNLRLLNGLFFVHPIIIYTAYALLLYLVNNWIYFSFYNSIETISWKFTSLKKKYSLLAYIYLISIVLGSWWAQQELDWGGWWSWDIIEVCALFFFFKLIYLTHLPQNFLYKIGLLSLWWNIFLVFLIILAIRYNILLSIHNFLGLINSFIWLKLISIYVVIICFTLIYIFLKKFVTLVCYSKQITLHLNTIIVNFFMLINFFLSVFIFVAVFQISLNFYFLKLLLFILVYSILVYNATNATVFFNYTYLIWFLNILFTIPKLKWNKMLIAFLHYLIFIIIVHCIFFNFKLFFLVELISENFYKSTLFIKSNNIWQLFLKYDLYKNINFNTFKFNILSTEYFLDVGYYSNFTKVVLEISNNFFLVDSDIYNLFFFLFFLNFVIIQIFSLKSKYLYKIL
jgi:cytochrome c biogenesis factor